MVSDDLVQSIRLRLERDLQETVSQISELDEQVRSFGEDENLSEGVDQHIGDDSDVVYEQERLLTIRGELAQRRRQIESALEKMGRGEYGICENCGRPIAPERLEALPFVSLCIECQESSDRRESRQRR